MQTKYITINDVKIYHGDKISAVIHYIDDEHFYIDDARLCINDYQTNDRNEFINLFICQNEAHGNDGAYDKFQYNWSWNFKINEYGGICSCDTVKITSKEVKEPEDDDPMPANWICEEKIPEDI